MRAITTEAARPAIMRPPEWFRRRLLKLAGARRICRRAPLSYQPACKPGSVWPASKPAGVTAIPLVRRLPGASSNLPEWLIRTDPAPRGRAIPIRFCSRWGLPCRRRCRRRGALLPHRFTLAATIRYAPRRSLLCGTVPGTGRNRRPPDVIRHRWSMEPGLSSPAAFRHWRGAAVRPTDADRNGDSARVRQGAESAQVKGSPDRAGRALGPGFSGGGGRRD